MYIAIGGEPNLLMVLTGDSWLDPSTFRIMFDLKNNETAPLKLLRPLGQPSSFFRRMRIF